MSSESRVQWNLQCKQKFNAYRTTLSMRNATRQNSPNMELLNFPIVSICNLESEVSWNTICCNFIHTCIIYMPRLSVLTAMMRRTKRIISFDKKVHIHKQYYVCDVIACRWSIAVRFCFIFFEQFQIARSYIHVHVIRHANSVQIDEYIYSEWRSFI